jgi:hypothetical protein
MPNLGQIFTHNGGILVNAAFLLMTSAMLVGQAGGTDKKPAPAPATPVVSTGCGASCGGCQDACGCESFGHRLRERLRGLFNRNSCDSCDSCKPAHTCHAARSCDTCDSCRPKAWTWQRRCHEPACNTCAPTCNTCAPATCAPATCAPATTCNTCNNSCGCGSHAFLDRLREGFRRKDRCDSCDTCSTCNSCGAPAAAPPAKVEPIAPPKKMPEPKAPEKKPAQVRIDAPVVPVAPNAIPAIPTAPTVDVTPAPATVPVPRVEGDRRDPF